MFDEMRFFYRMIRHDVSKKFPSLDIDKRVLEIATIGGAEVLGIENDTGSLSVGKSADIIAVKIKDNKAKSESFSLVYYLVSEARDSDVALTMINGKVRYDIEADKT